jgi:hypothetical protein
MTTLGEHEYALLTLSVEDFEIEVEKRQDDALADDEWVNDAKEQLEFANSMSNEEWDYCRDLVEDYVWNACHLSEHFQDAREWAIGQVKKDREERQVKGLEV